MAINIAVTPKTNEPFDRMLKRFTRKVDKLDILGEYGKHLTYEKPSAKKRRLLKEARYLNK